MTAPAAGLAQNKPVVGLIGAIGAGKSTAGRMLTHLGGCVVDCDKLGHAALDRDDVKRQLSDRWGERVLNPDGTVNRRAVAAVVFADPAERAALEAIVFPVIRALAEHDIARAGADAGCRFIALDAAVLLEAGWHDACNKIIYLDAPRDTRLARLLARSGWGAHDLAARESAQWPADTKKARADAVVCNDGTPEALSAELARLVTGWGI